MPGAGDLEPRSCQVSARRPDTGSPRNRYPAGPQARSSCRRHGMGWRQWNHCGRPRGRSRPGSNRCGRQLNHGNQCWKYCGRRCCHPACRVHRRCALRLSTPHRPAPHPVPALRPAPHRPAPHPVPALRRDQYQSGGRPQPGYQDCEGPGTRHLLCCLLASQTDLLEQRRGETGNSLDAPKTPQAFRPGCLHVHGASSRRAEPFHHDLT